MTARSATATALAIAIVIATAGCASHRHAPVDPLGLPTALRAACAAQHEALDATVTCLEAALAQYGGAHDELGNLYVTLGRAQAQRVQNGELTEPQGRVKWDESVRTLREAAALRQSLQPQEMSLLGKIGYVLQSTAAGARNARAAPVRSTTPGASGLERWQPAALAGDLGQAIGSPPIASPATAHGVCRKAWVCDDHGQNCDLQDLCDSITALPSVGLVPLHPMPSAENKPLPSIDLPPLGTTACEYRQVNGAWRNVCR